MNNKRIIYTLFALTLLAGVVKANSPVPIDGIYYRLDEGTLTAGVAKYGYWDTYQNAIEIPAQVTYASKTYNVTSIRDSAFYEQKKLTSVHLPDGLTTIGKRAFFKDSLLTSINFPESVTSIGKEAFYNCITLASINLPTHIALIDSAVFMNCSTAVTQLIIPESVDTIKDNAFRQIYSMDSLVIPSNVKYIGTEAFSNLTGLNGIDVSWDSTQLKTEVKLGENIFHYVACYISSNIRLHVPREDSIYYAAHEPWSCFKIVPKGAPTPPTPPTPTLDTVILADTVMHMADTLAALVGQQKDIVKVGRRMLRDGAYNTMCLPFNVSADTIALTTCPLNNCTIYRLTGMTVTTDTLELEVEATDSIKAGKPYLVKYNGSTTQIDTMLFRNVTFETSAGLDTTVSGATMHGTLTPVMIPQGDTNELFMASNNTLKWNQAGTNLRSFRAWFSVENSSPGGIPVRRGMPARIVEQHKTPTDLETIYPQEKVYKTIENGQLIIIRGSMKFNAQGQRIQ